jgi:hypothetical protein
VDWIHLAEDTGRWRAVVSAVMNKWDVGFPRTEYEDGCHLGWEKYTDVSEAPDASIIRAMIPDEGGSKQLRNVNQQGDDP